MTPHKAQPDAVVTHHLNTFASGVARFNELLAQNIGVPLLGLHDPALDDPARRPLLSFKASELDAQALDRLSAVLDSAEHAPLLYLHSFDGLPVEMRMIAAAERVLCGNTEIMARIAPLTAVAEPVWTPGLLMDHRVFQPAQVTIFSFGMAHKIRTDMFRRLRALLEASGDSYALYVSTANHETASIRDAEVVYEEMHGLFPRALYFMGNLSDVAIFNQLRSSTFFAAFFAGGVRANNTSVAAAMEQGAVVITNLDDYSPQHLVHMETVIDLERCDELPTDPLVLKRISVAAMEASRRRGWDALAGQVAPTPSRGEVIA